LDGFLLVDADNAGQVWICLSESCLGYYLLEYPKTNDRDEHSAGYCNDGKQIYRSELPRSEVPTNSDGSQDGAPQLGERHNFPSLCLSSSNSPLIFQRASKSDPLVSRIFLYRNIGVNKKQNDLMDNIETGDHNNDKFF